MRPYAAICVMQQNDCLAIAIRCMGVSPCCVCFVAFLHLFLFNLQFDLEPDYHKKANPSQNRLFSIYFAYSMACSGNFWHLASYTVSRIFNIFNPEIYMMMKTKAKKIRVN